MAACEHYVRKCSFLAPCCGKIYPCRFCHDNAEKTHELERKSIQQIKCNQCDKLQAVVSHCTECGIKFGFYFCETCRLYDDRDKGQFHCDLCGVCRVGGQENFFHCLRCDMCYPNSIKRSHVCIEQSSRADCPICMEGLHTSPVPCQVLRCGHLLHQTCFQACLKSQLRLCPLCSTLMVWIWDWKIRTESIWIITYNSSGSMASVAWRAKIKQPSSHILPVMCGSQHYLKCRYWRRDFWITPFYSKDSISLKGKLFFAQLFWEAHFLVVNNLLMLYLALLFGYVYLFFFLSY